jgi:hypothetical protein
MKYCHPKNSLFYVISIKLSLSGNDYRNKTQNEILVKTTDAVLEINVSQRHTTIYIEYYT